MPLPFLLLLLFFAVGFLFPLGGGFGDAGRCDKAGLGARGFGLLAGLLAAGAAAFAVLAGGIFVAPT